MERVSIFIDGSNLYHGLKDLCGRSNLDYRAFVEWLVGGRRLLRTYYYNAAITDQQDPNRPAQQRFFAALAAIPYFEVRTGRLEARRSGTFVEKGVDIAIAVDMLSMAYHDAYDVAILVSSDGDFAKVINAVKDLGKHVEAACFPRAFHVREAADRTIELTAASLQPFWLAR
jgi:uncharacterized LabA/DUF88 family protein